ERGAQRHACSFVVIAAKEALLQAFEMRELLVGLELRMIRYVIGDADELVERQDRPAVLAREQPRGHREILISRALAGPQLCRIHRHDRETLACTRPFHSPPRPRTVRQAESSVYIM